MNSSPGRKSSTRAGWWNSRSIHATCRLSSSASPTTLSSLTPTERDSPIGFTKAGYRIADTSSELRTRWCDGTGTPRLASVSCVLNLSIMSFIVWLFEPM